MSDQEKTGDIKCPKCQSNNCEVKKAYPSTIGCICNDCGASFVVPNSDGVATLTSD